MITDRSELKGIKATVMGLGLHGGGIATARFLAESGAIVTVTDLGSREKLQSSVDKLSDLTIDFVLGEHRDQDFREADLVVKNPAVPATSPYLKMAKQVETDISLFLRLVKNPIIAVTGSKGKSTTVSAVYHVMQKAFKGVRLGGNITVSPLTFIDKLQESDPVILELSSWQLHDLGGKGLLKPQISVITNIMHDHQNRYNTFQDYVEDKKLIYKDQEPGQISIFAGDDRGDEFASETKGAIYRFFEKKPLSQNLQRTAWLEGTKGYFSEKPEEILEILPETLIVPGEHFRLNMLIAALILYKYGTDIDLIKEGLSTFNGVPHRMELFARKKGVSFYNDSAATIPEATAAAVKSFTTPLILITGGTDKELRFNVLGSELHRPKAIFLLEGSGTDKILPVLKDKGIEWNGPFSSLEEALKESMKIAREGDSVLLSPGCTSFGMFLNEFDRGNKFKDLVSDL